MATATASTVQFPDGLDANNEPQSRSQYAVEVTSPVSIAQLDFEIMSAKNWRNHLGLCADGGDPTKASAEQPVVLYAQRSDLDDATFLSMVLAHEPKEGWNAGQTSEPVPVPTFEDSKAKVAADAELTNAEIRALFRGLLPG